MDSIRYPGGRERVLSLYLAGEQLHSLFQPIAGCAKPWNVFNPLIPPT
jgi:hypothetical protein